MKKITIGTAVAMIALSAMSTVSFAAAKKASMMSAKTMSCPACHMPMSTHKSAGAPVAVKIGKSTYYCCTACKAGKMHMKPAMGMKKMHAMKMHGSKKMSAMKM